MPPASGPQHDAASSPYLTSDQGPRVVVYHQTHIHENKQVSILPLLPNPTSSQPSSPCPTPVTHLIIAAIHINSPTSLTLNDDPPSSPKFAFLWSELAAAQRSGIKVLGLLGGAAQGSFTRLDGDAASFEAHYSGLHSMLRTHNLDGLDLDVEERMSLQGVIRLIDRLRTDFGPGFLITLSPVATALVRGQRHLSGFDYFALEAQRGNEIAWYNAQFYCGWGDASNLLHYDVIVANGWDPSRVVMGLSTAPECAGFVPLSRTRDVLKVLRTAYPSSSSSSSSASVAGFGGVAGWEYFFSEPGGKAAPWEWAFTLADEIRRTVPLPGLVEVGRGAEVPGIRPSLAAGTMAPRVMPGSMPNPPEGVQALKDLGFSDWQATRALNMTGGNVEYAASMLFEESLGG